MTLGLFTIRIVLQVLGNENFGIYTLVSGVVVLFTFLNNSLLSGTQRFLSYELGKDEPKKQIKLCWSIVTTHPKIFRKERKVKRQENKK